VLDPIVRRRNSLFGHVARLPEDTPAHQAFQTRVGGDVQAVIGTAGLTNSAGATVHLMLTSGDEPSCVDTQGDATALALTTTTCHDVTER